MRHQTALSYQTVSGFGYQMCAYCAKLACYIIVIDPFIQFYQLHSDDYHDKILLLAIKAPVLDILEHPIKLVCRIPHHVLTCYLSNQRIDCKMGFPPIFWSINSVLAIYIN